MHQSNPFFFLGWQIPGGWDTNELPNAPQWGPKKRTNAPPSILTAAVFIDRTVE